MNQVNDCTVEDGEESESDDGMNRIRKGTVADRTSYEEGKYEM